MKLHFTKKISEDKALGFSTLSLIIHQHGVFIRSSLRVAKLLSDRCKSHELEMFTWSVQF
jgi:hypothetical protein